MTATPPERPFTLMFVCTANICRSAYATVRATTMLAALPTGWSVRVVSGGTYGHTGDGMDAEMAAQAAARGSDPSWFLASKVNRESVAGADVVLCAETGHRSFVLEEWPGAFKRTFTITQFADAIASAPAELSGAELVAYAQKARVPARPAGNIKDPYRRGPEAAEACADELDALLQRILPRLAG